MVVHHHHAQTVLEDTRGVARGKSTFLGDLRKSFLGVCDRFVFSFRMYLSELWINRSLVWAWTWNLTGNVKKLWFLAFPFFSKFDLDTTKLFRSVDWILHLAKRGNLPYFFDSPWDWREVIFIGKRTSLLGFLFSCVLSSGCSNGVINCGSTITRGFDSFLSSETLTASATSFRETCRPLTGIPPKSFSEFFFCCSTALVYINLTEGKACICRELLTAMSASFSDDDFSREICLARFPEGGGGSGVVGFTGCSEPSSSSLWKKEKHFYIMRRSRKEILYDTVPTFNQGLIYGIHLYGVNCMK